MTKIIRLIALILTNFKGVKSFTLDAAGNNIDVYGDNAAGKTTLFDAFSWLLFDKDSQSNSKPELWIKTLDSNGNVIHKLDHTVEGVLDIDGRQITLKKIFKEKWTTPRGTAEPVFDGHTTVYYFNGSELKKNEYIKQIASIIDEELFKLLTNPSHFNDDKHYDQKKRRALLFGIFGDSITDDDVIKLNPKLKIVQQLLADKSIDQAQTDIKKELSRVDKELKDSDSEIRAQQNSIFASKSNSLEATEKELANTRALIADKQAELSRVQNGGELAVKQQRKLELQNEQLQLKNELQASSGADAGKLQERLNKLNARINEVLRNNRSLENKISIGTEEAQNLETKLVTLRSERDENKARTLDNPNVTEQCPTCEQSLPVERVEAAFKAAVEQFNFNKSQSLERIIATGKATSAKQKEVQAQIEEYKAELEKNEQGLKLLQDDFNKVTSELNALTSNSIDITQDERYKVLQRHINNLDAEMAELQTNTTSQVDLVKRDLEILQADVERLEIDKASRIVADQAKKRIEELKANQKSLAKQYDELSEKQAMLVEFSRTKAELLEQRINDKFPTVRFRLFEQQVNGELKDTCDTLYGPNLVPYNGGLNRAAQINAGLEIINALSAHYQVVAPIFIDNAEAVTQVAVTAGQQIQLIVSAGDKQLRTEQGLGISAGSVVAMAASQLSSDDQQQDYEQDDLF